MNAPQRQVDRATFLAGVRQSGLLTPAQLASLSLIVPETTRARTVARALVERGLLTRFQAERILVGRTAGFQLGQYRILDQLGRGGMGRVFKAEHRTMGRIVALKVLSPGLIDTERAQELFLREVRAAARLIHPNIVTAYDANELNGRFYLVLEFVDGPNLDQLVKVQGPLPVGLACDYIRQAAQGLQCAHALGMVHRDIKPAWSRSATSAWPGCTRRTAAPPTCRTTPAPS
jgi:serine/threonine-protein kinase